MRKRRCIALLFYFLVVPYRFVKIFAQRLIIYNFLFSCFSQFMFLSLPFQIVTVSIILPMQRPCFLIYVYCGFLVPPVFTAVQHHIMSDSVRYIHTQEQAQAELDRQRILARA